MIVRSTVVLVTFASLVSCGKSGKDTAGKVVEPTAPAPTAPPSNKAITASPTPAPAEAAAAPPAAQKRDSRDVYSLIDNRLAAHISRGGGLLVEAGSAGFEKYQRLGNVMKGWKRQWELRQTEGEIKVARIVGKTASIHVPLTDVQAKQGTVRIRAFASSDETLSLKVNDNKDINGKVAKGWSTLELAVPAGQLAEGENALALFAKSSGLEVAWLQVGGETAPPDDGAAKFYDASSKSLVIPKDGAMTWFVAVPDKAKLVADVPDAGCAIAVTTVGEDGHAGPTGKLSGAGASLDLAALAGKPARIDLTATGCAEAHLPNAALEIPGAAPTVARGPAPKHVIFIVMDSLRADRVRPFNAKARPETPNFDKLAESSAMFVNTYVQGNESQVSHAAIWSSNYLAKHKAIEMHDHLADKWVTIDEVAKKAGMFVAGASGNGYIRPARGFGSGWDQFVNHIEKGLGLRGADIMDKGLSFVAAKKDQPWFVYLGLIDTHVTWRAKQPWMGKYDGGYKGRFQSEYGDDGPNGSDGKGLSDAEHDHVRALYDSNVSYQDDLLGQLIEKLKTWGVWDQTMLIVVADHGDEQWEDGRVGHGGSERETLLHVPLVIHYPPQFPAGKVLEGAEAIDIVPTLADALGVANDPEWQGGSLMPIANGAGGYPLMSFSSQYENAHAGRIGHWKMKLVGTGAPKLYDLATDGEERKDLWGDKTSEVAARALLDPMLELRQWNVEWKKSQWGNAADVSNRFASDLGE